MDDGRTMLLRSEPLCEKYKEESKTERGRSFNSKGGV